MIKKFLCPLRWRTQKCNVTKSFIFGIILMMMIIVMLFLGCTPSSFNIPRLYFKVAHPKVQCNQELIFNIPRLHFKVAHPKVQCNLEFSL